MTEVIFKLTWAKCWEGFRISVSSSLIFIHRKKKQKVIFIYKLNNPNIQKLFIVDETIENINNCVLIILVLCMYTHKHFSEYGSYYGSNYEMNLLYKTNTLHNRLPFWSSGFNVKTNLMFQSSFFSIFFNQEKRWQRQWDGGCWSRASMWI